MQPVKSKKQSLSKLSSEPTLLQQLLDRLGPSGLKTRPEEMADYLREERGLYQGQALAIARPASVDEVAFIVQACAKANVPIIPQGGNTGLVGGQVAFGGLLLSLQRLNNIRKIDAQNGTITVDAGCTLQAVQEAASGRECLFPLSLASEGTCQIGGNIATNAGGTAVLRYGNMRELVLGLEVVLADGRIWNGLRGLRKDNAGYDLKQFFIGSEGTLGIITGAVLKLFPKVKSSATAFLGFGDVNAVQTFFNLAKIQCGDVMSAFEFLPRFGLETVIRHGTGRRDPLVAAHSFYGLLELSSVSEASHLGERMESLLERALEAGLIADATLAANAKQAEVLWALREDLSWAQRFEGGSIKHDISVPISRVAEFVIRGTALCEAEMPDIRVCAFGHLGDGNVHFNLSQPLGMEKAAFLAEWGRFNRIVHDLVIAMDGSIAAEHGIGCLKRDELVHYKDKVSLDLMRKLKEALDPASLFNPGKVLADRC